MSLSYLEDFDSVIPAIQVLNAIGWQYLSREEALRLRNNRLDQVILTGVLSPWLEANNRIEVKGESHLFSEANITEAIRRLTNEPFDGLVRTNEKIFHLLTLGTSLDQTIDNDRKGRSLHYINWDQPEKNIYHVTTEFAVERLRSHETARPDIVLFVNGIPFVVVECKRRDKDRQAGEKQIEVAISQQLRNQKDDWIPHLFQYTQMLIGTSVNDIRYGTVGTPRKFWSVWKEEGGFDQAIHAAANQRFSHDIEAKLFAPLEQKDIESYREARQYFTELWAAGDRLPTAQDRALWALLRPERLLEIVYGYVVFDAGIRKIARYQQYFAVKATVARVLPLREGQRQGGVIWHTTGSGKSITMVMLAKALALHPSITNPRVVIVTDRVDLDDQIWRTFSACGKTAEKANTGEQLVRLITEGKASVITTIINKFATVRGKYKVKDPNPNIFVLVDESHRTNYGTIAAQMRRVFPNACYLGFTGTPLLKREKSTARKFGGFIHSYTMREAVEDEAVAPLLYEGRMALLEQNQEAMQRWFDRLTANLTETQKADLKRKMARKEVIQKAEQRLRMIAFDISVHYRDNFQTTGFKAQLAADSRTSAIQYRKFFREFGILDAEVIMSPPDTRGGEESLEEEDMPMVNSFWTEMMKRFGKEEEYLRQLINSFSREDGIELLIVVSKLLTGFDEPRNRVLYVDKPMREHNILQAIARVNRIYPGKDFGYVVDYRGILGELNQAMNTYEALGGFDAADVDLTGAVIDTHTVVRSLPQKHSDLWDVFKEVRNKHDNEALEQHLTAEDSRQAFYEALTAFQQTLSVALSTDHFYEETPVDMINAYKADLKRFRSLRASVQQRFSEAIDYGQYEKQVRKVMDSHIQAPDVEIVSRLVNIFDVEAFDAEVERRVGPAAKADTIASRMIKTIYEKIDEDPVFYRKFAELVQQAIEDYRQHRITDAEYLKTVLEYLGKVRQGHEDEMPGNLRGYREAPAYYGVVGEVLESYGSAEDKQKQIASEMAIEIEKILAGLKGRDWTTRDDLLKDMQNAIDDYLFDAKKEYGVALTTSDMDEIIERCLVIAKKLAGG
ncbi:MAG: HsdR family type I site-specific deoxyribonuclease [Nitrospiraceae bacterium]|nr:HsdR family type I site-specific deoxyribonuclease [Nitrospiraceae bacterium]